MTELVFCYKSRLNKKKILFFCFQRNSCKLDLLGFSWWMQEKTGLTRFCHRNICNANKQFLQRFLQRNQTKRKQFLQRLVDHEVAQNLASPKIHLTHFWPNCGLLGFAKTVQMWRQNFVQAYKLRHFSLFRLCHRFFPKRQKCHVSCIMYLQPWSVIKPTWWLTRNRNPL